MKHRPDVATRKRIAEASTVDQLLGVVEGVSTGFGEYAQEVITHAARIVGCASKDVALLLVRPGTVWGKTGPVAHIYNRYDAGFQGDLRTSFREPQWLQKGWRVALAGKVTPESATGFLRDRYALVLDLGSGAVFRRDDLATPGVPAAPSKPPPRIRLLAGIDLQALDGAYPIRCLDVADVRVGDEVMFLRGQYTPKRPARYRFDVVTEGRIEDVGTTNLVVAPPQSGVNSQGVSQRVRSGTPFKTWCKRKARAGETAQAEYFDPAAMPFVVEDVVRAEEALG